jgi:hypothetical protein
VVLHKRGPHEIAVANTAVLLHLLHRLTDRGILPREQALAILGDAADELERDPKQASDVHLLAADIIRKELVPKI